MTDWMENLKSRVDDSKASKEQSKMAQMRKEANDRMVISTAFIDLEKSVRFIAPTLNQTLYGVQTGIPKKLDVKFEDNTQTGDHFWVVLENLSFRVKYKQEALEITAQLWAFIASKRTQSPISQANFTLTVSEGQLYLKEESRPITIEEAAQKLFTTIVETAEGVNGDTKK